MQRYYNIDIGRLGDGVTAFHASSCFACLPAGSLTMARYDPSLQIGIQEHLIYAVLDLMCGKHYPRFWEERKRDDGLPELGALPVDEMEKWYAQQFKEVEGCQTV